MFKRLAPLTVIALLLSLFLVACGGSGDTSLPTYSGSKSVTVPDELKKQFNTDSAGLKEGKFEAFSTADAGTKVKTGLQDELKKKEWKDAAASLPASLSTSASQLEALGGFILAYEKSNTGVIYIGFPGLVASGLGMKDVNANDTLVLVLSGKK